MTKPSIQINSIRAQRTGQSAVAMLRTGDSAMAALMAKLAASEVRLAVTRAVDERAQAMLANEQPYDFFAGITTPALRKAAACILVAEDLGWTRTEVEIDAYRAEQSEWNRSHGMGA